jgi:hypothetical protein
LLCLAEFQTPTIFDHNFDFDCSISYRASKIMKIIIYNLYIFKNLFTILTQAMLISVSVYMVISFQSYKISFYIKNLRRFSNSVNGDYKIQLHGK